MRFCEYAWVVLNSYEIKNKEAARYNQIPFVGCKYGYGKPEELSDCKYSVETALELSRIIDEIISARGGAD